MRISNHTWLAISGLACVVALPLRADDVALADGDSHLTGSVRSIDEAGRVELVSPLSPQPLVLKGGSVKKVDFSTVSVTPDPPSALIELANGDLLPATVKALDDRFLTAISPEAGTLQIPRDCLTLMQLGIHRSKVIYSGPHGSDEWSDGSAGAKNWEYRNHGLVARGQASASKKLALPRQFILRFTMKWEPKQVPNFQVRFADPLMPKGEAGDCYYLQFGGAGLEIKREAAEGKRYNTIVQLNRTPNQYPDRELQVEIRVNRVNSRLQLFLDSEPEGEWADPITPVPSGSGIALLCNAPSGSKQEIRNIEVLEYDDSRARHHAEDRGDPKIDSLISRDEDRWGGHLIDIRETNGELIFRFKSDFQEQPLEIPESDVSTVFFAHGKDAAPEDKQSPFVVKLRDDGSLRVSSCRFSGDAVSAVHPLLGSLNLHREGIVSFVRTNSKSRPESKP